MQNFPGLSREAALVLGGVAALVNGIVTVAGLGGFEDGLQLADLIPIIGPVLAALGIRETVFSKATVDGIIAGQQSLGPPGKPDTTAEPPDDTYKQGGKGPG